MHEFSIANAILQKILNVAEKNAAEEIKEANISIGELTFLNKEQLIFALKVLSKETKAEKCKFNICVIKTKIKCLNCGYKGKAVYEGPEYHILNFKIPLNCPKCKSKKIKIVEGKEVLLKNLKIKIKIPK